MAPRTQNPVVTPLLVVSLLTIAIWGAHEAADFLVPLSFSALLAFLITPLVHGLRRVRAPEWLAILLAVIAILAPFFTLGYFLSREIDVFVRRWPSMLDSLQRNWNELAFSALGKRLHLDTVLQGNTLRARAAAEATQGFQILLHALHALLTLGSEVVLVILLGVVMVISRNSLRRGVDRAFDSWGMSRSHGVLDESMYLIERFLIARLALVLLVAILDLMILRAFNVEYFVLLAVFLGVMTLIPAVGYVIALTPTLLISLLSGNSLLKSFFLFVGLTVVSALESHVLTPKWVGKRINLNLLATFVGLFAGERLWGVPGMFLSLPLLAIIRIVFSASPALKPLGDLLSERGGERLEARQPKPRKTAA